MENQLPVGWQLCNVEFIADLSDSAENLAVQGEDE